MSEAPLVSVIVTSYNQAKYITEALDSVRGQTFPDWHLVITDDASTDGSQDLIRSWLADHDLTATLVFGDENVGLCAILNRALEHCRGRYLVQLGGDDLLERNALAWGVAHLADAPADTAAVFGDGFLVNEDGSRRADSYMDIIEARPVPDGNVHEALFDRNFVLGCSVIFRRDLIEAIGGWDPDLPFEDWDMHLRMSEHHRYRYLDRPLSSYRIHDASMTQSRFPEMVHGRLMVLEKWLGRRADLDARLVPYLQRRSWRLFKVLPDLGRPHVRIAYAGAVDPRGRLRRAVATRPLAEQGFNALRWATRPLRAAIRSRQWRGRVGRRGVGSAGEGPPRPPRLGAREATGSPVRRS